MSAAEKPDPSAVHPGGIPNELKARSQWVGWRFARRDDKWTKAPVQAANPNLPAKSTDPATWGSFAAAMAAYRAERVGGIGYALTAEDPFVVLDIDHCVDEDGMIDAEAQSVISELNSFTEWSPSGRGVHVWLKGKKPGAFARNGRYELYETGRYMTVTGHALSGVPTTIEDRQAELESFYHARWTQTETKTAPEARKRPQSGETLTDDQLLRLAREARNGAKFAALWMGDTSDYQGDASRADAALIALLCFYTRADERVRRLMLRSGLNREKFNRPDYLPRSIAAFRATQTEWYEPSGGGGIPRVENDRGEARTSPAMASEAARRMATTKRRPWPQLRPEALRGLAGDIVRAIDPHTEGDPVGVLATFLAMFGNAAGRSPHVWIGEDRHGVNEFFVLVGATSEGRKGSTEGGVVRIMRAADAEWSDNRRVNGLASGEGFVWQIRDPIYKINKKGETECVDEGVSDKRLFVLEAEFSNVLKQTERDQNILSEMIRRAWDSRDRLQKLTISNPVTATNPHVSIVGHITEDELRKRLNETEMANGLGNRFLWLCVKRSKAIPEPTRIPDATAHALGLRVGAALRHARRAGAVAFTEAARQLWGTIYADVSAGKPGLLGALTNRKAPHVRRLALMYATLDCADQVDVPHLQSALAVMDYAAASVLYLFGDATGNDVADRILTELREAGDLTRTEINRLFSGNVKAQRITTALDQLQALNLAAPRIEPDTGGAPRTIWSTDLISFNPFFSYPEHATNRAADTENTPADGNSQHPSVNEENELNEKTPERAAAAARGACDLDTIADPARWPNLAENQRRQALADARELAAEGVAELEDARRIVAESAYEDEAGRQFDTLVVELAAALLRQAA